MILRIFTMYDTKANAYVRPFFMPNVAMAQRAIVKAGQDIDHPFAMHPRDFILYGLGSWDEESAEFHLTIPEQHGSVRELTPEDKRDEHDLAEVRPNATATEADHG